MVYIAVTSWYPTDLVPDVVKVYLEMLQKYPPDPSLGEQVVPAAVRVSKDGVNTMGITKVIDGKFQEAFMRISKGMAMFQSVKGFEYSVDVWSTIEEAMETIGRSMPG